MRAKIAAVSLCLILAACGGGSSTPTTPTAQPTVTGTWKGSLDLQGVAAQMTWTLTQTGTAVTGPVIVALPTGTVLLNGSLTGSVNASSLSYTIAVGPGGIPSQPNCTGRLDGAATTNLSTPAPTIVGTYTVGASTCQTAFSGSTFTLAKQ